MTDILPINPARPPTASATTAPATGESAFANIIDVVNPLQHIPVVSNIYRKMTGDDIHPVMRVAGGGLFGGPLGMALSLVSVIFESYADGEDTPQTAVAGTTGPRPGGWIVNAAYGIPDTPSEMVNTENIAQLDQAINAGNFPEQRPGGWIVNAAYGQVAQTEHSADEHGVSMQNNAGTTVAAPGGWIMAATSHRV